MKLVVFLAGYTNSTLVVNGNSSILIDTGKEGKTQSILKKMETHGLQPSDLKLIILTHTHFDHAGNVAELKNITGAKVLVHKNEADCLSNGYTPIPGGSLILTKVISFLGRKLYPSLAAYPGVEPDIVVEETYSLEDFGVDAYTIHTPGHTDGSISVVFENKTIVAGDCFFSVYRKKLFPPFANDPKLLLKTWQKIAALNLQKYISGHGSSFKDERFKNCLQKRIQNH